MNTEPVIGLDFGTTNSAIAIAGSARQSTLATFDGGSAAFRSILYFPAKERGSQQKTETQAGPDSINSYLEADTKGRLIVSIKSYLASSLFTSTSINGRNYTLEDLIAIILRRLRIAAMEQFETSAARVVLGRPVRFAGADTEADEKLALERLQAAAELAAILNSPKATSDSDIHKEADFLNHSCTSCAFLWLIPACRLWPVRCCAVVRNGS